MTPRLHRVAPCACCGEACLWEASIPPPAVCIACRINSRDSRAFAVLTLLVLAAVFVWWAVLS